MQAQRPRAVPVLGIAILALAVAFTTVSCGDDAGAGTTEVMSAIAYMDAAGLHEIDESVKANTIPGNAQSTAEKLQAVALLTDWPTGDLDKMATNLAKIFGDMSAALEGEKPDMARVSEAVRKAHDAEHDFSHEVWNHLYKEAGLGGHEDTH